MRKHVSYSSVWPARATIAALAGSLLLTAACSRTASQAPPDPPGVPVTVAKVESRTVPVVVTAIGQAVAFSAVSLKPQVSAELMSVHFTEGQDVHKGDLLFTLDKRPFEAALAQAQATLARDKAQAQNAAAQAQRSAKLFAAGIAAREQNDQAQADASAQAASVHADEAAVETARLQLEYCTIYSPIDGRTGTLLVHVGNLVKGNDVPVLVTINQIAPIYVDFSVPEQYLAEVKKYLGSGHLEVQAFLPDDPQHPESGSLSFYDNQVDSTTGTIKLRGTFPNPSRRLWPGQFVNCVVRLSQQLNAIVVPSQAVQEGQQGPYVFVVKPDMTADLRLVSVERSFEGQSVISSGLAAGETIVTDGQLRLAPGSKVELKSGL
jgi:membrane fusion protein, multidrug efflux system